MTRIPFGLALLLYFLSPVRVQSTMKQGECHTLDGTPCLRPTDSKVFEYFRYFGWNSTCFKYKGKQRCMVNSGRLRLCSCSKECDCGSTDRELMNGPKIRKSFHMKEYGRKRRLHLRSGKIQSPAYSENIKSKGYEQWVVKIERNKKGETYCYINDSPKDSFNKGQPRYSPERKEKPLYTDSIDESLHVTKGVPKRGSSFRETPIENPMNDEPKRENKEKDQLDFNQKLQKKCKCTCGTEMFLEDGAQERNNERRKKKYNLEEDGRNYSRDPDPNFLYSNGNKKSKVKEEDNCPEHQRIKEILRRYDEIKRILKKDDINTEGSETSEKKEYSGASDPGMFSFAALKKTMKGPNSTSSS